MPFLFEIIRLGLQNLRLHKLRSFLTSLGIILGVAAVIIMVAIGEGTKQAALRDIQALGATNIIVRSSQPPESANFGSQERSFIASYGIKRLDLRRLEEALGDYCAIVPVKQVGDEMSYGSKRIVSQAYGTTPLLAKVANLHIARGRYLTDQDMHERSPVVVIGDQVAQQFFPLEDPLGQEFRIGQNVFRVVGVLRPVGLAGGAGAPLVGRDLNKDVHLPLTTGELIFGDQTFRRQAGSFSGEEVQVTEIYVNAPTTEAVTPVSQKVERIMEVGQRRQRDFSMIVPWELLERVKRTQAVWNAVLITIAGISLLIGGIGIMNIMLASVTERTREIGIRRALGATRNHITVQFLVETGTLAAAGGVLGIALGVGASFAVGRLLPWLLEQPAFSGLMDGDFPFETQVTTWSIVASFIVASSVGLIFGIYPAVVASQKDPIVALRHD